MEELRVDLMDEFRGKHVERTRFDVSMAPSFDVLRRRRASRDSTAR